MQVVVIEEEVGKGMFSDINNGDIVSFQLGKDVHRGMVRERVGFDRKKNTLSFYVSFQMGELLAGITLPEERLTKINSTN